MYFLQVYPGYARSTQDTQDTQDMPGQGRGSPREACYRRQGKEDGAFTLSLYVSKHLNGGTYCVCLVDGLISRYISEDT